MKKLEKALEESFKKVSKIHQNLSQLYKKIKTQVQLTHKISAHLLTISPPPLLYLKNSTQTLINNNFRSSKTRRSTKKLDVFIPQTIIILFQVVVKLIKKVKLH